MRNDCMEDGKGVTEKVSGIILAGGKSQRLGRNKAFEKISGEQLICTVNRKLREVAGEIIIVTSRETSNFDYPPEAKVLVDIVPGKGPLSGILTGLSATVSECSVVAACDMPFINVQLLRYLIERSPGYDAVVPHSSADTIEPLCAVYSKRCINALKRNLESGRLDIRSLFSQIKANYIPVEECRKIDPELLSFINVNNPDDLKRALEIAGRAG